MKKIEFIKRKIINGADYIIGKTGTFSDGVAAALIDKGFAKEVLPHKAPKKKATTTQTKEKEK